MKIRNVLILAVLAGLIAATPAKQSSLKLISPDGRSSVELIATDVGAFVLLNGPKGQMINLFSIDHETGLAAFREGGSSQAISIGVRDGEEMITTIPKK